MKTLGANSIRVYHVDPTANHDECMQAFDDAGIYIWLDLDTFSSYIEGPGISTPRWNETQYKQYQAVMDAFHNYDNLAGFFVGNEVLTTAETSVAAPYVKAAARDMKAYRDAQGYRKIPVGYTAAVSRISEAVQQASSLTFVPRTSRFYARCCRTISPVAATPPNPSTSTA